MSLEGKPIAEYPAVALEAVGPAGFFGRKKSRPRLAFAVAVRLWDACVPDAERCRAVAKADTACEPQSRRPQRHRDTEET